MMVKPPLKLALFDLDHTLLPIDSDYAWGNFTTTIGWTEAVEHARQNDAFYADYQAGVLDVHAYVRFATRAARLQGAQKAQDARQRFMREVIAPAIRPEALALVRAHQAAGDTTVIVTATNAFVTAPIARAFGIEELIAVELETDANGWITGEIRGTPSFREGKVARVAAWLGARGQSWEDADITFYSDSLNDQALMECVQHPVATNPSPALRALAEARGWRILDLFGAPA